MHYLTIPENKVNSKCTRVAKFLQVNQEQAVWWSESYIALLDNSHRQSLARLQLPKPAKTTEMDNLEEDNQDGVDGNNLAEFSINHPEQ